MTLDDILARLEGVRRVGDSKAVARCPGHEDSSPSLSLRDSGGTILLHCFGGCSSLTVCQALGIEYADLFPEQRIRRIDPSERRTGLPAVERLALIQHEAAVVLFIGAELQRGVVSDGSVNRLADAVSRITAAAE